MLEESLRQQICAQQAELGVSHKTPGEEVAHVHRHYNEAYGQAGALSSRSFLRLSLSSV